MSDPPEDASALPPVRMEDGLLLCPSCGSMDLSRTGQAEVLACDDCGVCCSRHGDQCPRCGSRGMSQVEQVGFPAPGQSPREAPVRILRSCESCGYSSTATR